MCKDLNWKNSWVVPLVIYDLDVNPAQVRDVDSQVNRGETLWYAI